MCIRDSVDAAVLAAGETRGLLLKHGHAAAVDAEHGEELVPETLRFGALAGFIGPFAGEAAGAFADFVETQWHGGRPFTGAARLRGFVRRR